MSKNHLSLALDLIKQHEGFSPTAYHDSVGKLTIGYGRNLEENPLSKKEAEFLLVEQVKSLEKDLSFHESYQILNSSRKSVLLDMAYNLGYKGLLSFKKMWTAIDSQDYTKAAEEMLESKWATQVGIRATLLAEIMKNG